MITGGSTTEKIKANYFIATKRSYENFELRMKIKCSGDPATGLINSGIQIRSVRVPGGAHMSGYQVDCGKGWFGKIYDEFRRNKVIHPPFPRPPGPTQWLFQGPPAESKFLAARSFQSSRPRIELPV